MLQYSLPEDISYQHDQYCQDKHEDADLIDPVHEAQVDVGLPGRIFFSEVVFKDLAEVKIFI